jgi:hypothetical protein
MYEPTIVLSTYGYVAEKNVRHLQIKNPSLGEMSQW